MIAIATSQSNDVLFKSTMERRKEKLMVSAPASDDVEVFKIFTVHSSDSKRPFRGIAASVASCDSTTLSLIWYEREAPRFPPGLVNVVRSVLPSHEQCCLSVLEDGKLVVHNSHLQIVVHAILQRFAMTGMCASAGVGQIGSDNSHIGTVGTQHVSKSHQVMSEVHWAPPSLSQFATNELGNQFTVAEYTTECELFVECDTSHTRSCSHCQHGKAIVRTRASRMRAQLAAGGVDIELPTGPIHVTGRAANTRVPLENLTEVGLFFARIFQ